MNVKGRNCRQQHAKLQDGANPPKLHAELILCSVELQDFPDVPKSAKYDGKVKPDKIEWDKIIKDALEAGKEVPEIGWAKPGADAALAVSIHHWPLCSWPAH